MPLPNQNRMPEVLEPFAQGAVDTGYQDDPIKARQEVDRNDRDLPFERPSPDRAEMGRTAEIRCSETGEGRWPRRGRRYCIDAGSNHDCPERETSGIAFASR
jgi:hypothetical protein